MNERAKTVLERVGCIQLGRHRRRGGENSVGITAGGYLGALQE